MAAAPRYGSDPDPLRVLRPPSPGLPRELTWCAEMGPSWAGRAFRPHHVGNAYRLCAADAGGRTSCRAIGAIAVAIRTRTGMPDALQPPRTAWQRGAIIALNVGAAVCRGCRRAPGL